MGLRAFCIANELFVHIGFLLCIKLKPKSNSWNSPGISWGLPGTSWVSLGASWDLPEIHWVSLGARGASLGLLGLPGNPQGPWDFWRLRPGFPWGFARFRFTTDSQLIKT